MSVKRACTLALYIWLHWMAGIPTCATTPIQETADRRFQCSEAKAEKLNEELRLQGVSACVSQTRLHPRTVYGCAGWLVKNTNLCTTPVIHRRTSLVTRRISMSWRTACHSWCRGCPRRGDRCTCGGCGAPLRRASPGWGGSEERDPHAALKG